MLKIMIKTKGTKSDTSTLGISTVEEMFASYQALLIVVEDVKQRVIREVIEARNVNYEEAEKEFNRLAERFETVVKND